MSGKKFFLLIPGLRYPDVKDLAFTELGKPGHNDDLVEEEGPSTPRPQNFLSTSSQEMACHCPSSQSAAPSFESVPVATNSLHLYIKMSHSSRSSLPTESLHQCPANG